MAFIEEYKAHIAERETLGVPPLPLNAQQTVALVEMIKAGNGDMAQNIDLLTNRVSPGVDDAAYVKAAFLNDVASEKISVAAIAPAKAVEIMGMMQKQHRLKMQILHK